MKQVVQVVDAHPSPRPWYVVAVGCVSQVHGFRPELQLALASIPPGVPFLVARMVLHQHSGLFNIDFALLTVLVVCGYRVIASALFLLTCVLECLRLLDAVYFFSEQDLTFGAHFLADVSPYVVAAWVFGCSALCAALLAGWLALVPRTRPKDMHLTVLPLAVLLAVAACVDVAQGFNPLLVKPHGRPRPHLVGEVLVRMPLELSRGMGRDEPATPLQHSATDTLWGAAAARTKRENVVVVVVESMGLLVDSAARAQQFAGLVDDASIRARYTVEEGSVPFTGPTVVGEMRELCHLRTNVHVGPATLRGQPPCLPQQYAAAGYQTAAYHGYNEHLFMRKQWYPSIGFQERVFASGMAGLPHCPGAFFGVCDTAVAAVIERRLVQERQLAGPPQFLYWMTLNSHLPISTAGLGRYSCPITAGSEVCSQLGLVNRVLESVKTLALDPAIGPTTIVVVGDHAPPYADVLRREWFDDGLVPFLVLQPRA